MNYNLLFNQIIDSVKDNQNKPKLLLHACCAPCSTYVLELLKEYFDITIYYFNPNIDTKKEYDRRVEELNKFLKEANLVDFINLTVEEYESNIFYKAIKDLEKEPEGGKRCFTCYELRLEKAAKFAVDNDFDYFTTVLSISPYKNANKINEIGKYLEEKFKIKYLYADFKKNDGYKKSVELSKKYKLYRQDYCGCIYSKIEKEKRLLGNTK